MAKSWQQTSKLVQNILANCTAYDPLQLLHLIETLWLEQPLKLGTTPIELKLITTKNLGFYCSVIKQCILQDDLTIEFSTFGLGGSNSPLPDYFAEKLLNSDCLHDFLNIFNNRIYLLLYLSWRKYYHSTATQKSLYLKILQHLSGNLLTENDTTEFAYASSFISKTHNAYNLRKILQNHLQTEIKIQQQVPTWINPQQPCRLNQHNHKLGDNIILGDHVVTNTQQLHISIGPIDLKTAKTLFPQQPQQQRLANLIWRYLSPHLTYKIILLIKFPKKTPTLGRDKIELGFTSTVGICKHLKTITIPATKVAG